MKVTRSFFLCVAVGASAFVLGVQGCSDDLANADLQFERERNAVLGGQLLEAEVENEGLREMLTEVRDQLRVESSRAATLEGTLRFEKARNAALLQQLRILRMEPEEMSPVGESLGESAGARAISLAPRNG